jgi:hypothetical protein
VLIIFAMWVSLWENVWQASVEPTRGAIYDTRLNRLGPSPCLRSSGVVAVGGLWEIANLHSKAWFCPKRSLDCPDPGSVRPPVVDLSRASNRAFDGPVYNHALRFNRARHVRFARDNKRSAVNLTLDRRRSERSVVSTPLLVFSVAQLLDACTRADYEWIGFCNGYMQAALDAPGGRDICVPRNKTRNDVYYTIIPKLKNAPGLQDVGAIFSPPDTYA